MTTIIASALASTAALAQANDDGLSFDDVLSAIPTDPASIFTLLLLLGSLGLVLWFGRPRGGKGGKTA